MVNALDFRWPKPFFFMVLGAHGTLYIIHSWMDSRISYKNCDECPRDYITKKVKHNLHVMPLRVLERKAPPPKIKICSANRSATVDG